MGSLEIISDSHLDDCASKFNDDNDSMDEHMLNEDVTPRSHGYRTLL